MKGYVYVLTNECMPGLVKIGRSIHAAGARSKQIYRGDTGVPVPFDVAFECLFDNAAAGELKAHQALDEFRENPDREFFRVPASQAVEVLLRLRCEDQATDYWDFEDAVGVPALAEISRRTGLTFSDINSCVRFIPDSEWIEASEHYKLFMRHAANKVRVYPEHLPWSPYFEGGQ